MSLNYSNHIIAGNLTKDHELRYTPKGTAILVNSVAVNRRWKNQDGEVQEAATFYDIKAWGARAETINKFTQKGSPIFLTCRMENETWDDKKTGQPRRRNVFVVEEFSFVGPRRDDSGRSVRKQTSKPNDGRPDNDVRQDDEDLDDDIPF